MPSKFEKEAAEVFKLAHLYLLLKMFCFFCDFALDGERVIQYAWVLDKLKAERERVSPSTLPCGSSRRLSIM